LFEGIGQSQIVPLLNNLVRSGLTVSVVSLEKEIRSHIDVNLDSSIKWVQKPFGRRGILGAVLRLIRISISLPSADVFHARGDLAAASTILRGKHPVLWDVRGLWIDQKIIIGTFPNNFFLIWLGRKLESFVSKRSNAFTTLSLAVVEVLRERNKCLPNLHAVIPTCVDLKRFKFSPKIPNDSVLLLSGVFNNYYDLELIRIVSNQLEESGFDVVWYRGAESVTDKMEIKNLKIYESRYEEMPQVIVNCSLGLAICKTNIGDSLKGVMPTKVAEFLAVGRPVLISEGMGDLDSMVLENSVGWTVKRDTNFEELTKSIRMLINDEDLPQRCREVAEKYFSMEMASSKYTDIYRESLSLKSP